MSDSRHRVSLHAPLFAGGSSRLALLTSRTYLHNWKENTMLRILVLTTLVAILVLSACGPSATQVADTSSIDLAQGKSQFALNCGECHGNDGTGTDEAPAIGGHSLEEVMEQVRNPMGDMEAIAPDVLSDADLQLIAGFVASLPGEEAHPEITPTEEESVHLLAAFEAIEDYEQMDREAAIDHLQQALALATGESAEVYAELIEAIESGKAGTARHELKELLGLAEEHMD